MNATAGRLEIEVVEVASGALLRHGGREVRAEDVEVQLIPPPEPGRIRSGLRDGRIPLLQRAVRAAGQTMTDAANRLVRSDGRRSIKRLRLQDGFTLQLHEGLSSVRRHGFALTAGRQGTQTFCWQWFRLPPQGSRATGAQETGLIDVEHTLNRQGAWEIVSTVFVTDVAIRINPPPLVVFAPSPTTVAAADRGRVGHLLAAGR